MQVNVDPRTADFCVAVITTFIMIPPAGLLRRLLIANGIPYRYRTIIFAIIVLCFLPLTLQLVASHSPFPYNTWPAFVDVVDRLEAEREAGGVWPDE